MRPVGRALVACTLCALLTGSLLAASMGAGEPSLASWTAAEQWYEQVGAGPALVSVIAPLAFAISAWLLLAATAQLLAIVVRGPLTTAAAVMLSPRSMQRFVHGVASGSLAVGLAITAPTPQVDGEPGTATLELVAPEPLPPPPSPPPSHPSVTVAASDSFWSIAASALRAGAPRSDTHPTTAEIACYWVRLIDANRAILVQPSNPDLIFRGQVVALPEISPASPPGSPLSPGQ